MNTPVDEDDARRVWHSQALPPLQPMSPQDLARKAMKLHRTVSFRNRREMVVAALVTPVFLLYAWIFPHWLTKLGALLFVAGSGVMVWQMCRRASARPLPETLAASLLAFHRSELMRQRDALRAAWLWYVAPLTPGLVMLVCGRQIENGRWQPEPFIALALVMVSVVLLNLYAARRLQRDIDALDELDRQETP